MRSWHRLQKISPVIVMAYAVVMSMFAIDWAMSASLIAANSAERETNLLNDSVVDLQGGSYRHQSESVTGAIAHLRFFSSKTVHRFLGLFYSVIITFYFLVHISLL